MSSTAAGREAVAKFIVTEEYIDKLIPLVEIAEDLESLPDLHRLCNIIKTILLLNNPSIIEHSVSDECLLGVVGDLTTYCSISRLIQTITITSMMSSPSNRDPSAPPR
ncbi:component of IIS longevity pathway SMK-1 domain-containing protein [Trichoderma sp. SZMC 28014]